MDAVPATQSAPAEPSNLVAIDDMVQVLVFNHPEMSGRSRVGRDGNLTVGLLGDVLAVGKSPAALASDITEQLTAKKLAVGARVTVTLDEVAPIRISIIGEVGAPGLYSLSAGSGVAEALASSGGFTNFAHRDRLFVLRRNPEFLRIRFTFADVARGLRGTGTFRLRSGDLIVVE